MALLLTLRVARGPREQQATLDDWLRGRPVQDAAALAVVAEGAFFELAAPASVPIARLAAGCVCCVGELPLRVTLARILRQHKPRAVLLIVADATHLERVRAMLTGGQFGAALEVET